MKKAKGILDILGLLSVCSVPIGYLLAVYGLYRGSLNIILIGFGMLIAGMVIVNITKRLRT